MNRRVANVEETDNTSGSQQEEVVEAGGVFWLNAVEGNCCEEGFKIARNTIKPDSSWRRPLFAGDSTVPVQSRFSALQEVSESETLEGKITIDSGAADSVMPMDTLKGVYPLLPKKEGVRFCAANGQTIQNYGRRQIAFRAKGRKGVNCMTFHVTDVKKPLASVSKIVEKGSSVHFTPEGSVIEGPN